MSCQNLCVLLHSSLSYGPLKFRWLSSIFEFNIAADDVGSSIANDVHGIEHIVVDDFYDLGTIAVDGVDGTGLGCI